MPRKKAETEVIEDAHSPDHPPDEIPVAENLPPIESPPAEEPPKPRRARAPKKAEFPGEAAVAAPEEPPLRPPRPVRDAPVLTIEAGGSVETSEDRAEQVWHEIRTALRTKKILTGILCGMERGDNGSVILYVLNARISTKNSA